MTRLDQIAAHAEAHDFATEMEAPCGRTRPKQTRRSLPRSGFRSHCWTGFESAPSSTSRQQPSSGASVRQVQG